MDENPKLKNSNPKAKEKRLPITQNENPAKKNVKVSGLSKSDLAQLTPPQNFDISASVKNFLNEANKIVRIGLEKEFAIQEKNHSLQNSNETIENLRKNILHLQMEYEKLDQNYQREISARNEIIKRMDATKETVESVVQYSNTLASSLKLLEDDKCKIIEYYELIYQGQKEIEAKHTEAIKFINEVDSLIKSKIQDLKNFYDKNISQRSEMISQLNRNLSHAAEKLKISEDENEKLQTKIKQIQDTASKMESSLHKQQTLNDINQKVIFELKSSVKSLKSQTLKYQKLLKNKKRKNFSLVSKNKTQGKKLKNVQNLLEKFTAANKILESQNYEWKTKFENQLQEEALRNQNWEAQEIKLSNKIKLLEKEYEEAKIENENLNKRVLELMKNEEGKQKQVEDLQTDLSKMLSSNLTLQEDLKNLNDESTRKENKISDLEAKVAEFGFKINSSAVFHQNETETYRELVKELESQLSDAEAKLALEKNQKEILLSDYDGKLESLKIANEKINNLEKLLRDKEAYIKEMEFQQNSLTIDGKKAMEKLNKDVEAQRAANKELTSDLKNLEVNYASAKKELQEAKNQILYFEEKLNEEQSLSKKLKGAKNELEKNAAALKKEIENEKYSSQELQEKNRKAEKELAELKRLAEENASLKSNVFNLKNILKATEARVETYRVAVKKLESEKAEAKCSEGNETSKLHRQEEARTPQRNVEHIVINDENELQTKDTEKRHETPSTPVQSSKKVIYKQTRSKGSANLTAVPIANRVKFLTTPRKIFTSTPQPDYRNQTPFKKKRDPYEFDSDHSVERFDSEQVLKVFNRQKKDTNKKSKTNK